MLVPDKLDDEAVKGSGRFGVFGTTVIAFFLAEMGDKTQIATVALAAHYNNLVRRGGRHDARHAARRRPGRLLGDKLARKVPMRLVHGIAAAIFALLGPLTLRGAGRLP